jgi:adenylate kinase family enzyme
MPQSRSKVTDMSARAPEANRVIAIFGPPGAGKTTVARALSEVLGRPVLASGDIARRIDPDAIARGDMADREKLRAAFAREMLEAGDVGVIVDGLPRDPGDLELLNPSETLLVLLNCSPERAIDRQLKRGRDGDTVELVVKRTAEQRQLMELDKKGGWAYEAASWRATLNTSNLRPDTVIEQVTNYVLGRRSSIA